MKRMMLVTLMLGLAATVAQAETKAAGTGASFKGPLGLQLYSLRESFKQDVPGTLELVKALGIQPVELAGTYGQTPEAFRQLLDSKGLQPIAGHFGYERFRDDPAGVAREAKALGLKFAGCAWIPHQNPFDEKQCRAAIDVFNKAGAALAQEGLQFYYHTHGYEFVPFGDGTLFDLLVQGTDPKNVRFEMDVTWVVFPGQDPAKLLQKYGARWALMHLKDLKQGVAGNLSGGTDPNNDVPLGQGQAQWPAILKAAQEAGVQWYFLEDESKAVKEQLPISLKYLENVTW